MKSCSDLDFLNSFWEEAKKVGGRIKQDLPQLATPNIESKGQLMYLVKFSDISGKTWGVEEVLKRVMGRNKTLEVLADKIMHMILNGRANDVKPMVVKICSGRIKSLSKKPSTKGKREFNTQAEYLGKGHFRWNKQAYTLTEIELRRLKKYFNLT